jgi:hypothetical protein
MKARSPCESITSIFPTHYIDITIRNSWCFHGEAPHVFAARNRIRRLPLVGYPDPANSNNIPYLLNILSQRGTNACVP